MSGNNAKKWLVGLLTTILLTFGMWVARSIAEEQVWRAAHNEMSDLRVQEFREDILDLKVKQDRVLAELTTIREALIRMERK